MIIIILIAIVVFLLFLFSQRQKREYFTKAQVAALRPDQLIGMTNTQLPLLDPLYMDVFTPEQLKDLTSSQTDQFTASQWERLTGAQINSMNISKNNIKFGSYISSTAFKEFLPEKIKLLDANVFRTRFSLFSPEQVKSLDVATIPLIASEYMLQFSPTAFAAFTVDQIKQMALTQFTPNTSQFEPKIALWSAEQYQAAWPKLNTILANFVPSAVQIASLTPTQWPMMNPEKWTLDKWSAIPINVISSMPKTTPWKILEAWKLRPAGTNGIWMSSDIFSNFSPLSFEIAPDSTGKYDLSSLIPTNMFLLSPAQFAKLPPAAISQFSNELFASVTPAQISGMTVAQIQSLTPAQMKAVTDSTGKLI